MIKLLIITQFKSFSGLSYNEKIYLLKRSELNKDSAPNSEVYTLDQKQSIFNADLIAELASKFSF